ncbi:putative ankyrin repeat protein [Planoprotostelium fungivorum]|uniref:Putative ankyrin repeat protein n=1 Tax=Planoprotostelium fungivorum TaxID=1890364 RepID=A0A2P6NM05_9EUKA|nr:putative ankyrin repeat protein [Planoprotostelium fungivorum]
MQREEVVYQIEGQPNEEEHVSGVLCSYDDTLAILGVLLKTGPTNVRDQSYVRARSVCQLWKEIVDKIYVINNIHLVRALNRNREFHVSFLLPRTLCDRTEVFLHAVRVGSQPSILKTLLNHSSCNPAARNNSALQHAAHSGDHEVVKILLEDERVDPSDNDNYAIQWASHNGHIEIVTMLMRDKRVNPAANDDFALVWASHNCHHTVVRLLLNDARPALKSLCRRLKRLFFFYGSFLIQAETIIVSDIIIENTSRQHGLLFSLEVHRASLMEGGAVVNDIEHFALRLIKRRPEVAHSNRASGSPVKNVRNRHLYTGLSCSRGGGPNFLVGMACQSVQLIEGRKSIGYSRPASLLQFLEDDDLSEDFIPSQQSDTADTNDFDSILHKEESDDQHHEQSASLLPHTETPYSEEELGLPLIDPLDASSAMHSNTGSLVATTLSRPHSWKISAAIRAEHPIPAQDIHTQPTFTPAASVAFSFKLHDSWNEGSNHARDQPEISSPYPLPLAPFIYQDGTLSSPQSTPQGPLLRTIEDNYYDLENVTVETSPEKKKEKRNPRPDLVERTHSLGGRCPNCNEIICTDLPEGRTHKSGTEVRTQKSKGIAVMFLAGHKYRMFGITPKIEPQVWARISRESISAEDFIRKAQNEGHLLYEEKENERFHFKPINKVGYSKMSLQGVNKNARDNNAFRTTVGPKLIVEGCPVKKGTHRLVDWHFLEVEAKKRRKN